MIPLSTIRLAALSVLAASVSVAQPKIGIEGGKQFDFGNLYTTAPVTRELRITNRGDDTLRVTDVAGSCGCTGTLLSDSKIPPGGSGTLKITFDPAKFKDRVEKVVSMKTNDPSDGNPHITFTATIIQVLSLDQTRLVFSTAPDSEVTAVVTIRNVSEVPVTITGTSTTLPEVAVELSRTILEPGGEASLLCRARPTVPGILTGDVTFTTDHPLVPSISVRLFSYTKYPKKPSRDTSGK